MAKASCCLWQRCLLYQTGRCLSSTKFRIFRIRSILAGADLDAGAHGRSQDAGLDILTLCSSRLCLDDGSNEGVEVLNQLLGAERNLADGAVDDVGLVETILDLTGLDLADGLSNIGSYGAGLGEGMRPLGPRTLPRRPTMPIMSGVATTTS